MYLYRNKLDEQASINILLISILWATSGATYQRNKMILILGFSIDVKKEKVFLWAIARNEFANSSGSSKR